MWLRVRASWLLVGSGTKLRTDMDFLSAGMLLADAEGAAPAPSLPSLLMPMVLIVFVWYFLILRPQGRERKARELQLANLKRNDRVVTYSGIIGTITGFSDDNKEVTLRVDDNVKLRFFAKRCSGAAGRIVPHGREQAGGKLTFESGNSLPVGTVSEPRFDKLGSCIQPMKAAKDNGENSLNFKMKLRN